MCVKVASLLFVLLFTEYNFRLQIFVPEELFGFVFEIVLGKQCKYFWEIMLRALLADLRDVFLFSCCS